MDISLRLKTISNMITEGNAGADIGTDHAYIPIYAVKNNLALRFIASDINKGPVEKAKLNVSLEGLKDKIDCRLGGGLTTLRVGEVDFAVIAGMGGNLIRDIILEREDVFKSLKYAILQPVQNPEILREFIYKKGYEILDEELCFEENKYYEIIKVRYNNIPQEIDPIYFEVSKVLIEKRHPLIKKYVCYKIDQYNKILKFIKDDTELANKRKDEVKTKVLKLEELIKCL